MEQREQQITQRTRRSKRTTVRQINHIAKKTPNKKGTHQQPKQNDSKHT